MSGQEGGVELREVTAGADVRALYEAHAADVYRYAVACLVERLADITGLRAAVR